MVYFGLNQISGALSDMKTFLALMFFCAGSYLSANEADRFDDTPVTMSFFDKGIYAFASKNGWLTRSVKFVPSDKDLAGIGLHLEFSKDGNTIKLICEGVRGSEEVKRIIVFAGGEKGLNTVFHQILLERSKIDGFSIKQLPLSAYNQAFPDK